MSGGTEEVKEMELEEAKKESEKLETSYHGHWHKCHYRL
jgi:hypothetical protein